MTGKLIRSIWRWRIIRAAALSLAGAALLTTALIAGAGPKPPGGPPASQSPVSRGVQLHPSNRPEVYNKLPPGKQAVVDRENALRNQALQHPFKQGPRPPIPTPAPRPSGLGTRYWPAGAGTISKIGCDQLYRGNGLTSNQWLKRLPDKSYLVCAGARPDDPSQGWLFVALYDAKDHPLHADQQLPNPWFPTPTKAGIVMITDAVGEILTLQAQDGTLFYFDVGSLKYLDGPPQPAPEKTPAP